MALASIISLLLSFSLRNQNHWHVNISFLYISLDLNGNEILIIIL